MGIGKSLSFSPLPYWFKDRDPAAFVRADAAHDPERVGIVRGCVDRLGVKGAVVKVEGDAGTGVSKGAENRKHGGDDGPRPAF